MTASSPSERLRNAIENPFLESCEELEEEELHRFLKTALADDDPSTCQQAVLALGLTQARNETPVLSSESVSAGTWKRMGLQRARCLRVVSAAYRCETSLAQMLGDSPAAQQVRQQSWAACFGESLIHALNFEAVIRDHDVLILGETGTGKERIALSIQAGTMGNDQGDAAPSAALNAAAIPHTLIESELFGHVKGAFTGASENRVGMIRSTKDGCLFLDEVGDLEERTQVKLLRVMENNMVSPVGSDVTFHAHVRYVAATHKNLAQMVDANVFRADLYQRLAGFVITLPPLRKRREDIPAIAERFVAEYCEAVTNDGFSGDAMKSIERWLKQARTRAYGWPGNVRELQNALRTLMLGLSPALDGETAELGQSSGLPTELRECSATMREASDWYLRRVLDSVDGNIAEAARRLGVDRATVRRRIDPKS